jgi:methionine-rich copper-binding protein CopC
MMMRALLVLVLAAAAALPEAADAHALLVRTSPPKRAVLRDPPKQIELWFNERLEPAFATLSVLDRADAAVGTARPIVSGDDRKRLTLELPPLPPGNYTVRFRVLSVDGHVAEDSFPFSVGR